MAVLEVPKKLPFLEAICWQISEVYHLNREEMLHRYERGWSNLGVLGFPSSQELLFIKQLALCYGSWLVNEVSISRMLSFDWHDKIRVILNNLNAEFLERCRAYFGGGTLVSLKYGEHRLSKDIDLICPLGEGYRFLRQEIATRGYEAIWTRLNNITLPQPIQANQYGVKFPVIVDEATIKFEIVIEGRIQLGTPEYLSWCPIPCLNATDCFAEKLLANCDRWSDRSVESRDIIDLAVLRLNSPIPPDAITKAESAYSVIPSLIQAIEYFQAYPDYRERCYASLQIKAPSSIVDGLDLLASDFELEPTTRTFIEQQDPFDQ